MKKTRFPLSAVIVIMALLLVVACSTPAATPPPTAATRPGETPSPTVGIPNLSVSGSLPTATPSKVWTMKYDNYNTETTAMSVTAKHFYNTVAEQSGGRIKMEYYFSASLHPAGQQAAAVRDGTSETGYIYMGYTPAMFPLAIGLDQTYMSRSPDAMAQAAKYLYDSYYPMRYEFEVKNNVHLMYLVPMEPVMMVSKKPMAGIEDLKGLKIRSAGVSADTLNRLGATPVSMVINDAFEGLQRGTVDAVFSIPFGTAFLMHFYDAGKYWTDTGAGLYATAAEIMNIQVWNGLPDDIKTLFNDNASKGVAFYIDTLNTMSRQFVDQIASQNLAQLSVWPDDVVAKAKATVQPAQMKVWIDQVKGQGFDGQEFMTKLQALLTKYEPQTKYVSPFAYYMQTYGKK